MNGLTISGRNFKPPDRFGTKDQNAQGADSALIQAKSDKKKTNWKSGYEKATADRDGREAKEKAPAIARYARIMAEKNISEKIHSRNRTSF